MVQILILAAVAAFLFWRLSLVLGVRTGFEKTLDIKVQDGSSKKKSDKENMDNTSSDDDISDYVELQSDAGQELKKIKNVEPSFSVQHFVGGAKAAYEMILMAYENGDLNILENYLAAEVYEDFKAVVSDRADKGYTVEAKFVGLREIRIRNVVFEQDSMTAEIKVFFKCDLTSVVKDQNEKIIEGSSSKVKTHTDIWTFGKTMGNDDPVWKLIATGE